MAIDSVYSVSTTGSPPVNSTQRSAEDRTVEKPESNKDESSNTGTSSEAHTSAPTVNTEGQKTGTTISTKA